MRNREDLPGQKVLCVGGVQGNGEVQESVGERERGEIGGVYVEDAQRDACGGLGDTPQAGDVDQGPISH